jgi:hypothetical protein
MKLYSGLFLFSECELVQPRLILNKNEHVQTETNGRNVAQSVRHTLWCDVRLVYDFDVFFLQILWPVS